MKFILSIGALVIAISALPTNVLVGFVVIALVSFPVGKFLSTL